MTFSRPLRLLAVVLMLTPAWAQTHHDPLNPLEIDQVRDAAQEPEQRLKLYVQFARLRLTSLEQVRTDPKITDRGNQIHDRLQDFGDVYDELEENIDTFVDRKADLRKALKVVIESDTEFQSKIRALKDAGDANEADAAQYEFLLTDVLDTLDSAAEGHRQLLAQQEEAAKKKKSKPGKP